MKKDIKDYMHLYLGGYFLYKVDGVEGSGWSKIPLNAVELSLFHKLKDDPECHYKLILRHLSSMTEDEARELAQYDKLKSVEEYKDVMVVLESNGVRIDYYVFVECNEGDYWAPHSWRIEFYAMNAHDTLWCLNRGFDLFGLIDSGLAVTAETLK